MSVLKSFAVAASAVALLAGAPAGFAQGGPSQGGSKSGQSQELLGGPGYQSREYAERGGDRDYGDRGRDDRGRDDRDWRGGGFSTRELEGLRVNSAKDKLRRSGFSYVRAVRESGRQYDLWWDGRACVGFTSYNGRVTDVRSFRDAECGDITRGRGGRIEARELEGLWVDAAKDALRRAGFSYSHAIRINGRQYDMWESYGRRDTCVGFTSYNGRVTDARTFGGRDC